ncbi:hypothetical protein QU481_08180 [Crenobacter sp. SG2303]|uniref:Uncharacterized protein n=1 Tax=Crenobacter oryzisoli TaxID=3056844 RepID=A0ABT7XMA5_9NEIS|nr:MULTISPECIES: hypothetical protein [unclassified Crenobacter]MDN0074870.1 hypothetical protein [Crenobacter sp. SG2303]MDN0082116.1 hypothetical protein [Crenobacter sp. SG2305]
MVQPALSGSFSTANVRCFERMGGTQSLCFSNQYCAKEKQVEFDYSILDLNWTGGIESHFCHIFNGLLRHFVAKTVLGPRRICAAQHVDKLQVVAPA